MKINQFFHNFSCRGLEVHLSRSCSVKKKRTKREFLSVDATKAAESSSRDVFVAAAN
jgi:hypothetical protein